MAALAKTSKLAVLSQIFIVTIVVVFSPVRSSIKENGGLMHIVSNSIINGSTVFIGLGVLGFAFVCQHSAFLIAGSLERPTKKRWAKVTSRALLLCGILEAMCGIMGYLAFSNDTEG
jgi:sodium-coupled neutral amino acid transporter 11